MRTPPLIRTLGSTHIHLQQLPNAHRSIPHSLDKFLSFSKGTQIHLYIVAAHSLIGIHVAVVHVFVSVGRDGNPSLPHPLKFIKSLSHTQISIHLQQLPMLLALAHSLIGLYVGLLCL